MDVSHCHEIGGYCGLVSLFKSGVEKGARDEESRGRVGSWRRLMRMERTSVVSWRAVLVSREDVSFFHNRPWLQLTYRDGGSSLFLPCALFTGSYALIFSAGMSDGE